MDRCMGDYYGATKLQPSLAIGTVACPVAQPISKTLESGT